MSEFKKGDRVRVTFEGQVRADNDVYLALATTDGLWAMEFRKDKGVQVEKIEPPVEVFEPGDVVRNRITGRSYTVTVEGYVDHSSGRTWRDSFNFTSEHYDRVPL